MLITHPFLFVTGIVLLALLLVLIGMIVGRRMTLLEYKEIIEGQSQVLSQYGETISAYIQIADNLERTIAAMERTIEAQRQTLQAKTGGDTPASSPTV